MNIRPVDPVKDRQTLLEFHCAVNYASGSPALRKACGEDRFREIWLSSSGPEDYLGVLAASLKDPRTIAEIWEEEDGPVAYVWASFTDWPEYGATGIEVHDIAVAPPHQRRGIATWIMQRVEKLARERGARVIRSGTGIENAASRQLHARLGFYIRHVEFEKEL